MMNTFFHVMYALTLPFMCGGLFTKCLIGNRWSQLFFLERVSLAFLFGQALLAQSMLLAGWAGITFTALSLSGALLIVTGMCIALLLCLKKFIPEFLKTPGILKTCDNGVISKLYGKVLVCFGGIIVGYILYEICAFSLIAPMRAWDSFATTAFQAKVIFHEQGLRLHEYLPHADFPLHIPFSFVWFSQCLGHFDQQWIKILPPFYLLSTFFCVMGFCRRLAGRFAGYLSFIFILASPLVVLHGTIVYRDIPLMAYVFLTVSALCYGLSLRDRVWIWVAALSAGFGCFVKSEALFYMPIFVCMIIVWALCESCEHRVFSKQSVLKYVIDFLVLGGIVPTLYIIYKTSFHIQTLRHTTGIQFSLSLLAERSVHMIKRICEELFLNASWNIAWFALVTGFMLGGKSVWKNKIILSLLTVILGHMGIIIISACVGSSKTCSDIASDYTLARLFIHIFPVVVAALVIIWSKSFKGDTSGRES